MRKQGPMGFSFLILVIIHSSYNKPISDEMHVALSDVLQGPLKEKWILALIDVSAVNSMDESDILKSFRSIPVYLVFPDYSHDNHTLPRLNSPIVQENNVAVVLVIDKHPEWLDNENLFWSFNTVLVCNVNSHLKSDSILSSALIQRAENVALIEPRSNGRNQNGVGVFTSRPFENTANGQRHYKFFLAMWSSETFQAFHDLFPSRFPTFSGEQLHVSSDSDDFPFVVTEGEGEGAFYGLCILLLDTMGSVLNFTYTTTYEAEDLNWGEKVNGTWNGLLGELITRNKNLTINYFTFTYERSQDFDYSAPYFYEGFGFAIRMPLPLPLWMNLTHPLSDEVWIAILITLILFPILFFGVLKLSGNAESQGSLSEAYFDIFKSLLKLDIGPRGLPGQASGKLCLVFWWLGSLIITTSYTGNLVAVLTIPVFPARISSLSELAESKIGVTMVDYGEFVPQALATSKDSVLKKLGEKMTLIPWVDEDEEEAYRQMINNRLLPAKDAAVETYSYLVQLIRDDENAGPVSYILQDQIYTGPLVLYFPKHSPWHRRFDGLITRLVEAGIITKWYKDLMSTDDPMDSSSSETLRSLTMHHLQGPFLILIIGLGLSLFVCLFEISRGFCCLQKQDTIV